MGRANVTHTESKHDDQSQLVVMEHGRDSYALKCTLILTSALIKGGIDT